MKIFPYSWSPDSVIFDVVPTPDEPCAICDVAFRPDDLGVVFPHVEADGSSRERPWHRSCLLKHVGAADVVVRR